MTALELKNHWLSMPVDWFEPLTFGELAVGDKFIGLPEPGDNNGHGGLRDIHVVLTKTKMEVLNASLGIPFGIPTGEAKWHDVSTSYIPHSMLIIQIKE